MLVTLRGYRVNEINNANTKNLLNQPKEDVLTCHGHQTKEKGRRPNLRPSGIWDDPYTFLVGKLYY